MTTYIGARIITIDRMLLLILDLIGGIITRNIEAL